MKIIHLSDLHIREHTWSPDHPEHRDVQERWRRVVDEVNAEKADVIVITGDVTDDGFLGEFRRAAEVLKDLNPKPIVVPGNHDARDAGLEIFRQMINDVPFVKKFGDITFIGLNSTMPDMDEGMLGTDQLEWAEEQFQQNPGTKVVLLHHHLLPVPHTGREKNMLFDAGDMLACIIRNDIRLVLGGHRHQHNAWLIERTVIVNAGTTASDKLILYNKNSYNVITLTKDEVRVELKNVGGERTTLAHYDPGKLGVCKIG